MEWNDTFFQILPPFHHSAESAYAIRLTHHISVGPRFRRSAIPPFRRSAIPPFRRSTIPSFRHYAVRNRPAEFAASGQRFVSAYDDKPGQV